jgi:hypothetical protein
MPMSCLGELAKHYRDERSKRRLRAIAGGGLVPMKSSASQSPIKYRGTP